MNKGSDKIPIIIYRCNDSMSYLFCVNIDMRIATKDERKRGGQLCLKMKKIPTFHMTM